MVKKSTIIGMLLVMAICQFSFATEISGPLTGILHASDSPYQVVGDIYVPRGGLLAIEPGVVFDFRGSFRFRISPSAALHAVGTEADSIVFTCDTLSFPSKWGGVVFDTFIASSNMQYCVVEYSNDSGIKCIWSNPTITHCTIRYNGLGNTDELGGAGIMCQMGSNPEIGFNTIIGNHGQVSGGGIVLSGYSMPLITDNIISGNIVTNLDYGMGGGISVQNGCPAEIFNNIITDNIAGIGGGISLSGAAGCRIEGNLIENNYAGANGGGIAIHSSSGVIIKNNIIKANSADNSRNSAGGGIFADYYSSANLTRNIIVGNTSREYGGINITEGSQFTFMHEIIADNYGLQNTSHALRCDSSSMADVGSSIIWNNTVSGNITASYSDIQGGWPGEGNIDIDPLFRDPDNDDYHLQSVRCGNMLDSPCIDMGSPFYRDSELSCTAGLWTDRTDMGVYGGGHKKCMYIPGDVNGNGHANGIDVVFMINYFSFGPVPEIACISCPQPPPFYAAGDVNGNCVFNGIDVSFIVLYLKGGIPQLLFCPTCPPEE